MRPARSLPALALLALVASASPAAAQNVYYAPAPEVEQGSLSETTVTPTPEPGRTHLASRGECRRIARQITQYQDVQEMAAQQGNEPWEQSTAAHVERLEQKWYARCDDGKDEFAIAFTKALKAASKIAMRMLVFGML